MRPIKALIKSIFNFFTVFVLFLLATGNNIKNHIQFSILESEYAQDVPLYQPDMMSTVNMRDRVNFDFRDEIFYDRENVAFITKLSKDLQSARSNTSEAFYFENISRTKLFTKTGGDTTASPNAGDTRTYTLASSDIKGIVPGMTFHIMGVAQGSPLTYTLDFIVDSKTSTSITVRPAKTTLKIVAVPNSTVIYQTASRFKRGSGPADPSGVKTVKKTMYSGIRKNAFALDNTARAEKMYGPKEEARLRNEITNDHAEDLEASVLFNPYDIPATEDNNESDYQGLIMRTRENSPANIYYDTYDFNDFLGFCNYLGLPRRTMGGTNRHKLGLGNGAMMVKAWEMAMSKKWNFTDVDVKVYGCTGVKRLEMPMLTLDLFNHPHIQDMYSDLNKPYVHATDLRFIGVVPYRDTIMEMNVNPNGQDGKHHQIITEQMFYSSMSGGGFHGEFCPN